MGIINIHWGDKPELSLKELERFTKVDVKTSIPFCRIKSKLRVLYHCLYISWNHRKNLTLGIRHKSTCQPSHLLDMEYLGDHLILLNLSSAPHLYQIKNANDFRPASCVISGLGPRTCGSPE